MRAVVHHILMAIYLIGVLTVFTPVVGAVLEWRCSFKGRGVFLEIQ